MDQYRRRPPMEGFARPGDLGRGEAWDDDSVEGHMMDQERRDDEDVEGHAMSSLNLRATSDEDEDTEGHSSYKKR
jgi:hypothetical protein